MNTFIYRPVLTVIDVLEAGACLQGTLEYIEENDGQIFKDTKELLRFGDPSHYIKWASKKDGFGTGTGKVYGNDGGVYGVYGDGYRDGSGHGYSQCHGQGYVNINGDGYGDGYGDGNGYGNGNGRCTGDGYGDDYRALEK